MARMGYTIGTGTLDHTFDAWRKRVLERCRCVNGNVMPAAEKAMLAGYHLGLGADEFARRVLHTFGSSEEDQ